jgi:hypothetical protein
MKIMGNKYKKANELNTISLVNHATALCKNIKFSTYVD